ncbi:hypothetical protein GF373_01620 [bacterium]|nr:hypothetical protein [bacterium]
MIFLGEKEEDDPYWQPFLTQLGWTWHPTADEKPSIEPVTVSGSSLFAETLRMWDQTMWEPWLSSTQTHGLLAGETAQPILSYQVGDKPCTLLGQVRLGKGTGWIVNSSLNEKSEILLSPILPALLWETAKQVARDRRDAELDIPQAKRESNIQLLSETDKKQIQEKYPIQFATMETLRDGLDSLQGGMDLRMVFLFLCIVIAIMESWLANRLASM